MNSIARSGAPDIAVVRDRVAKLTPQFARALPPGLSADRFARVVLTAIQQSPNLLLCTEDSLWGACMKAAQDGLLPDGREGAIVPRYNRDIRAKEAHWMPMVAGLIAKAKRKGNVVGLVANVVYEGEPFEVLLGDDDRITHRREVGLVERGKEVAVYAIATMRDGSKEREVMSWEQTQQVRAAAGEKGGDVWKTWPEEMARKSAIRRLSKRLPSLDEGDDELRRAVERVDELYDFGKPAPSAPPPPQRAGPAPVPVLTHEPPLDWGLDAPVPEGAEAALVSPVEGAPASGETPPEAVERVQSPAKSPDPDAEWAASYVARLKAATTAAELRAAMDAPAAYEVLDRLAENRPRLAARVKQVEDERTVAIADAGVEAAGAGHDAPAAESAESAP